MAAVIIFPGDFAALVIEVVRNALAVPWWLTFLSIGGAVSIIGLVGELWIFLTFFVTNGKGLPGCEYEQGDALRVLCKTVTCTGEEGEHDV